MYLEVKNFGLFYGICRSCDGVVLAKFPTKRMADKRLEELVSDLFLDD